MRNVIDHLEHKVARGLPRSNVLSAHASQAKRWRVVTSFCRATTVRATWAMCPALWTRGARDDLLRPQAPVRPRGERTSHSRNAAETPRLSLLSLPVSQPSRQHLVSAAACKRRDGERVEEMSDLIDRFPGLNAFGCCGEMNR
jgi:hypothetical protein